MDYIFQHNKNKRLVIVNLVLKEAEKLSSPNDREIRSRLGNFVVQLLYDNMIPEESRLDISIRLMNIDADLSRKYNSQLAHIPSGFEENKDISVKLQQLLKFVECTARVNHSSFHVARFTKPFLAAQEVSEELFDQLLTYTEKCIDHCQSVGREYENSDLINAYIDLLDKKKQIFSEKKMYEFRTRLALIAVHLFPARANEQLRLCSLTLSTGFDLMLGNRKTFVFANPEYFEKVIAPVFKTVFTYGYRFVRIALGILPAALYLGKTYSFFRAKKL